MAPMRSGDGGESLPLTEDSQMSSRSNASSPPPDRSSSSSTSTVSLMFEHLASNGHLAQKPGKSEKPYRDDEDADDASDSWRNRFEEMDLEDVPLQLVTGIDRKYKRWLYSCGTLCVLGWLAALFIFVFSGSYRHRSTLEHDPDADDIKGTGRKITISQLQSGAWRPRSEQLSWISVPGHDDGYVLETGGSNGAYLFVEDIRARGDEPSQARETITLMNSSIFHAGDEVVISQKQYPSPDLKTVLCLSDYEKGWRHSYSGTYHLFDVKSQTGKALDPSDPNGRIQLAQWSPTSDAVVFTRNNNMFLRKLDSDKVINVTTDGGPNMFNGVPDWVYEEEVFSGNSATWWSPEGKFIAFLATNESNVPEFSVQYYLSRPSGKVPDQDLKNYPDIRKIKYPKAGAPNPIVHLRFYDVEKAELFSVPIENDFTDADRLITEVLWASGGKVLIRQTNRESDLLKMIVIDVNERSGKVVREKDVMKLDGGWFEITETTTFVPANSTNGRKHDGYIDTVIHDGYDHLAYFTPLNNSDPIILTSGNWEVVEAPSAIDLENNLVYFIATQKSSVERHVYKVSLDGSGLGAVTDTGADGYYSVSFSKAAKYALLSYEGPKVPWQKLISTPSNKDEFEKTIEKNKDLASLASKYELPVKKFETINVDGFELNVLERRPPHFDPKKKYPVLFFLYGGPGSQTVDKRFMVDFQSYVAATLGYIVVTVDGRGTGFIGRKARTIVRGNIGYWEANDQIEAAKVWAKRKYVDETRIAIWGWSYGGYMTLKTLEQDGGKTFKYGMAVAPVTDWEFYDSIYTERFMHTPQNNPEGYANASISNVDSIAKNVRWLIMHGASDDNVHFQNTLTLLDKFDMSQIENYDVHVFPDSDHSIYFHGANTIVYDKLSWWLVNAFNGEWERLQHPVPLRAGQQVGTSDGRMVKRSKREEMEAQFFQGVSTANSRRGDALKFPT